MSNGNDINVGSIEEDINELKTLLFQDRLTNYGKRKMINYYENEITRQKQINEEHQKINGELREEVKELEDKYILEKVAKEEVEELLEDSIPKQKIKDKIEEYYKKMEEDKGNVNWIITDRIVMNVLQKLLQESEDK